MTAVIQQHLHIDNAGVAWIGDTNIKAIFFRRTSWWFLNNLPS
jgi:hypothetical protein